MSDTDKTKVSFTFDDDSLTSLKRFADEFYDGDLAACVHDSLVTNRAIRQQIHQGYTSVIVRNPIKDQERILMLLP